MEELAGTDEEGAEVEVSVEPSGVTVLHLRGEVDIASVGAIRKEIEPVIAHGPSRVVFEVGELRFMDSSGLTLLLAVAERVKEVELRGVSPLIREVLDVTGVTSRFIITP